jgi:hypothetical protein
MIARLALLTTALLLPAAASAQVSANGEVRLTPEQVEQVLAEAAAKRHAGDVPLEWRKQTLSPNAAEASPARPVHGEMGFSVGTGSYRSAFGTAVIPLGNEGAASFTFETGRGRTYPYGPR